MRLLGAAQAFAALSLLCPPVMRLHVQAMVLDPLSPDSIRDVSSKVAQDLVSQYAQIDDTGVHVRGGYPGVLYEPYYWWQAGAMFGTLLDYWHYTGDSQYNDIIREGLIHQFGENRDLMPANQSKNEGNDDQVFWAFSMIQAAEYKFPDPPPDQPGWLAMTQSVFNQFAGRFSKEVDDGICGGGMRWQIHQWLNGWTYKNTASNGGLFHLGARLAMYTRNDTYADWAEKAFDWMASTPLLPGDGQVYDGMSITTDPPCKDADQTQWTYNYGTMIAGAAYMYNYTNGADKWRKALDGFVNKTDRFFPDQHSGILKEPCECETPTCVICNADQESFKAYLARWLAVAIQMAPYLHDHVLPLLQNSAKAAAQTCVGPSKFGSWNYACGMRWYRDGFDGVQGVGPQMSALNIISALMVDYVDPPYTGETGGTSVGDPGLGTDPDTAAPPRPAMATTGDKAGAWILTVVCIGATIGGGLWMIF